ncbi:zf-HC2 domain-containing protein [Microcoleus sp. FACHB-1515]|uniref:anti-sigma factor family protein n=1 Tax=Cyanophyceae TaxID=3028117 RepID=UPI0016862CF2|nr:zf-HC2 domain-containing protein [Microcoleus sp. FACHB-1515]MBD2090720.1 zf-HC2 domain-containing protein [Microcoleus sp. FACHB-1515]
MTSNSFDAHDSARPSSIDGDSAQSQSQRDTVPGALRDRFELLSAYLDGEVTANERRQVEAWLKHDPQVQCLYSRLLKLRQGMHAMPIPADRPIEQTVERVLSQLDRRRRKLVVWGGMAIAALFVGAVSVNLPSAQYATSQIDTTAAQPDSDALMIALDRPILEIPKAPVSPQTAATGTAPNPAQMP